MQQRIGTILVSVCVAAFLLSVIVPRHMPLSPRKFLYLTLAVVLLKAFWAWKRSESSRYLEILPFLVLFLISCFEFSRFVEYKFGVDDAYYYSYISSIVIDGDLDLSNQYQASGLAKYLDEKTLQSRTDAGLVPNVFPVGLSFFWSPFFWLGHFISKLLGFPLNGYSRPYTHTVVVGNLVYMCAGLYFCYRFCAAYFSKVISLAMTFAILLTTPYLWLFFHSFMLVSEPLSFALIAFFLFCIVHAKVRYETWWLWMLLGVLSGTMTMVRFHNAILGIIPVMILASQRRNFIRKIAAFCGGALIGFLPQLIIWHMIYGEWFVTDLGGTFLPFWNQPFLLETLFAARKGLLPWSPVVLLSCAGLFLFVKKDRVLGWSLILVVLATIWMNSAQADWWGATSLGARRFVSLASIFVVGLACLFSVLPKTGRYLLIAVLATFIMLNSFFVANFRVGKLQAEHADRLADVLDGPYTVFRPVVQMLQFPVQLAYKLRYGTPIYGSVTDFFIGEDIFYFQSRAGEQMLSPESPIFGDGWQVNKNERKTNANLSVLYVPMFTKEKPRFTIKLKFAPMNNQRDIRIDFYCNGQFLRSRKIAADGAVEVPIRAKQYRSSMNKIEMHIYHSRSGADVPPLKLEQLHFAREEGDTLDLTRDLIHKWDIGPKKWMRNEDLRSV
jgi:hypothetical protein